MDPYKEMVEEEAKQEAEAARKVLPSLLCRACTCSTAVPSGC